MSDNEKLLQSKNLSLTTKFMLGIGLILFCVISIISALFYLRLKDLYIKETYQKTDLVLGHIDATMEYVRDELRPQMFHLLPKDEFVREAMSTSFVNRGIMHRFAGKFPDYVYRRVSMNPLNPNNMADNFEQGIIRQLAGVPDSRKEWKGLLTKEDKTYFLHYKAIVMEEQCVMCHGDPSYAPKSLLERYGTEHGHYWKTGNVVGLESIAIPVDDTFYQIRQAAFFIFLLGLSGMAVLFLVLNYFYYVVSVRPLKKASSFFQHIVTGQKALDMKFDPKGHDEISDLADSFNQLVSHLKKSQDDLKSSELQYRRIFEGSKDTILITDCQGLIVDINNAGIELIGCRGKEEIIRKISLGDFFAEKDTPQEFTDFMERDGFVKDYEAVCRRRNGGEIHVLITATFRKDIDNDICGYECIIKDITERKRMEQQIRQADKLASIGQLAAGVAHEINNPLSIVLGYSKMLLRNVAEGQAREELEAVQNNAQLCKKIVEDLLNFSRQKKPHYTQADLNEVIENVISVMEGRLAGESITISREYDSSLPLVTMDVDKIKQVCMNLLMNSCQAMKKGGMITVATCHEATHGGIKASFSDTGSGVPENIRDRIFDPFFTTKEPGQGTGLGLAVSYGIIKEHHGEISFASEEGKGTTFMIWLPLEVEQ
ncbi:MAG TPA: DUF3365 domain-containing protein [Dissulfurispiraceae bacterium]|nr:DUF3365 domain-containing protein [Dissulfurispiraceae bacterium]